eukprot:497464-Rhodomonas_salina.1
MSEKFVETLSKGISTFLLQSNCPPEFWGAAAHYYTDVCNHTPHTSINNQIPYNIHHSASCDVSWFRPFGCHMTLFSSKDIVEHHKLAQHCEQGVMVGLGMAHCSKCWLVYCPQLNSIFASRNVTSDETLFSLKETDQRSYGFYNNQVITCLCTDAYGDALDDTLFQDILNMPLPEQPSCVTCNFDPITDNHFPLRNTIDVDVYTDRNNVTDNVANQVYSYIHNSDDDDDVMTDNATDADGTESSRKR